MTIKLLVSDMAGTTVRDDGIVESSFTDAIAQFGLHPGGAEFDDALHVVRTTMGMSKLVVFNMILGDEMTAIRATAAFEEAIATRIEAGELAALPGAEDTLRSLREQGMLIALTTGFGNETRELVLDALGWKDLADLTLSPGHGLRGRPHPDMALSALIRLGVDDVREMATVGDTASDLLAGWRSGAGVVAGVLTGAHDRATLSAAPHTHILDSILDLPPVLAGG